MIKFQNSNINKLVGLLIYIISSIIVAIYFFLQGYNDLNSFLSFYNLFSGGIIWQLIIGNFAYTSIVQIIIIFIDILIIFFMVNFMFKKLSYKGMYAIISLLSIIFIFIGMLLLSLGIWK